MRRRRNINGHEISRWEKDSSRSESSILVTAVGYMAAAKAMAVRQQQSTSKKPAVTKRPKKKISTRNVYVGSERATLNPWAMGSLYYQCNTDAGVN
ncbi:hypothetical protein BH11PLA2_BH11PLA2_25150 [soil metagenome]